MQPVIDVQPVTIAVTNFNGEETVLETLRSATAMTYPSKKILVVDDGSTDRGPSLIAEAFPDVTLVRLAAHTGRLNTVRNAALEASDTRLVFLVDNDVTFEPGCLEVLVEALGRLRGAAICTPVVLRADDRRTVYSSGHQLHYLCVSIDPYRDAPAAGLPEEPRRSVGGGIQLLDKKALEKVGYFNDEFALGWGDDGELHHRVNLSGLACYSVPAAVVYHPPRQREPRAYGQVHNRWRTLLQSFALRSIVLLLPALLLYEVVLIAFLARRRQLGDYGRALREVAASRERWRAERRRVQGFRRRRDRELLAAGSIYVPRPLARRGLDKALLRFLDLLFTAYWRGVSWLL